MKKLKKNLEINELINSLFIIFMEGFIEILVSSYLNFQNTISGTASDRVSNFFTILYFLISLTIVPGLIIYVMTLSEEVLRKEKTFKKLGGAYEGLKIKSKYALFYNLLFLIRRMVLVFILFESFFIKYESLQIIACIFLNNFCCTYLIWHMPYIEKSKNYNEILNEITIVISTEAMLLYTNILDPPE